MKEEIRYVLEDDVFWLVMTENAEEMVEEIAPLRTIKTVLAAGLGKWLTRKPGTKNLVGGNVSRDDSPKVAPRHKPEVLLVKVLKRGVDFAGENALVTEA